MNYADELVSMLRPLGVYSFQVRGLKRLNDAKSLNELSVAPHAGAWIETHYLCSLARTSRVAPHAGAWIETNHLEHQYYPDAVAPHAGAWIETL